MQTAVDLVPVDDGSTGGDAPPAAGAPVRATIIGAGLAGSLLAIYLGRRGYAVNVCERRVDPRTVADDALERRSINLGLSHRGVYALSQVGLVDEVLAGAVRARGRVIHASDGRVSFQPYGAHENEVLYSISRSELNRALIRKAEECPGVRFHFGWRCEGLDKDAGTAVFRTADGREERVEADFVVGADGAFSTVRQLMHRGERANFEQEFLEWGYKELTLPALPGGGSAIELEALHIWPRGDCLIVSHPNPDGSHTVTLFLPFEGPRSFARLQTAAEVDAFFREVFPDLAKLVPDLAGEFLRHPVGTLVSTRTAPWHYGDRVVLVGDGCHAVYPFYGQGMNAAMEDCAVLDACLGRHPGDRGAAFREYQQARKRNTDALCELVKQNFVELRDTANQPAFVARKKVDLWLSRLLPGRWMPLYTMVVHTTMPYAEALDRHRRQERIRRWLGVDALLALTLPLLVGAQRAWRWLSARLRRPRLQVALPDPHASQGRP
ncbi:MAG TPA: NAD(P)/FAD-dependent oxidoreductase [Longimicrobium sp.]|nr:NAD(P)/FAD-dependent oxidoreductase [Longimicrobium sp.]